MIAIKPATAKLTLTSNGLTSSGASGSVGASNADPMFSYHRSNKPANQ